MKSMRQWIVTAALLFFVTSPAPDVRAESSPESNSATLFENVRIFDGKSGKLSGPSNVLIKGNIIELISTEDITPERGTIVIDGGGRTLMPGLIDAHWHAMLIRPTPLQSITDDVGYNNIVAGDEANDTLMRGFTTVRDVGGPVFGLKRAIDEGVVNGPRIYPSGAIITVTSGHGDFRQLSELPRKPGTLSRMEEIGGSMVADSPDEVRLRVREQLMQGASQIKLTAGGRRVVAFQPDRRVDLHRCGASRGCRCRRELGDICHRARFHHESDPGSRRSRGESHRARIPDGRSDRQASCREGSLAEPPAAPRGDADRPTARLCPACQG